MGIQPQTARRIAEEIRWRFPRIKRIYIEGTGTGYAPDAARAAERHAAHVTRVE